MSLYFLKKYFKKHKDNIKNYFYENNKYSIFIFFPLAGLFYIVYYDANSWLIQPPGLIFFRWALIVLSINIFSNFYLCFLTNIVDKNLLQSLHQTIQKIIYSLFCVGIFQYINLNYFYESDIIELLHLIFVVPIFDFFFMYFCIQFILKLTTPYFFPSTSLLTLKIYRYLGIVILISYIIIRSGSIYLGFQLFSTAQLIFCIIIFLYFFKYLHFIRHIKTNLPHDWQIIWNKLKAFFGAKSHDKLVAIEVIVTLMNIIILYNLIIICSYILTIPEYYLFIFKRFINEPIILSTLDFSVINIFKAIFAFFIIDLFGKFVACRVTQQPSYANDIDKKLTVNIIIHYAFYILATLISLLFFGLSSAHIGVIIGTIGVGLGIGAQYIIHNIISGVIIITKKMIHVGDFITIQNISKVPETTTGKIEKISILSTQILDEDQLLVNVPNSYILENCIVNYTSSENINTCYINLKIKNTQEYHDIVNQIIEIIKGFSEIIQDYPYGPAVKLLQSITKEDQDYRNINISFSVSNPTEKQFIYSQIKNKILKKLKNQIFIDKKTDVI